MSIGDLKKNDGEAFVESGSCLSLWERQPSAARTERVDTLRKHAGVDTLRKYAGGIFLVSISAAMLP